jgi:hypothetical protein
MSQSSQLSSVLNVTPSPPLPPPPPPSPRPPHIDRLVSTYVRPAVVPIIVFLAPAIIIFNFTGPLSPRISIPIGIGLILLCVPSYIFFFWLYNKNG